MSLYTHIQSLKAQITDTERMLRLVGNHPLMSFSLNQKVQELRDELSQLPQNLSEAKATFLFSGSAVKGSEGIKSSFVSKTVPYIQDLVKTQTALTYSGRLPRREKKRIGLASELYITSLPTGSFGYELSQLETTGLFDAIEVANSIKNVIALIESTAKDESSFEQATESLPKKSLNDLKQFFKEVADEKSMLKMDSGDLHVELSASEVKDGFERVSAATKTEEEVILDAILKGFLLESGRFELVDIDGKKYNGTISSLLDQEEVIEYNRQYLNKFCKVHLQKVKTKYITGNERISYELLKISDV